MEKIKYAIFDVDGTLMDSMHIWDTAAGAFLMMRGIQPKEKNLFRSIGFKKGIDYMIETYNLKMTEKEILNEIIKILENYYYNIAPPKDGIKDFLKCMKNNGVRMVIATATDRFLVEPALKRNGIFDYFEKIFTCNEVGTRKFEPDIYDAGRDYFGTSDGLYVFEDAAYAIKTVINAGYKVVGVEDYSAEDDREWIKENVDIYIRNYSEAYELLSLEQKR